MHKGMYARPNKVNTSWKPLAVNHLEFLSEGHQREIGFVYIIQGYLVLVHQAHPIDEFTVVRIIWIGKDAVKERGTKAIEIEEELPGLVPAGEFLRNITRGAIK
jgi:hypothetical protein